MTYGIFNQTNIYELAPLAEWPYENNKFYHYTFYMHFIDSSVKLKQNPEVRHMLKHLFIYFI